MTSHADQYLERWAQLVPLEVDLVRLGASLPPNSRPGSLHALWRQWQSTFDCIEALAAYALDAELAMRDARGKGKAAEVFERQKKLANITAFVRSLLQDPAIAKLGVSGTLRAPSDAPGSAHPNETPAEGAGLQLAALRHLYPLARAQVLDNRRHGLVFTYRQVVAEGRIWESAPRHAHDLPEIVRGVQAGFLVGNPRWAVQLSGPGGPRVAYLNGLDATGRPMSAADAERLEAAAQEGVATPGFDRAATSDTFRARQRA